MKVFIQVLVVVVALVVSVPGGWVITRTVLRLAARSPDAGSPGGGGTPRPAARSTVSDGPDGARARAVLRGGTWIGILERIAVTGCVLAGDMTSVALVVAVKGLGRYPELRENPSASERFVIGTLTSMIWAALVGAAGQRLLH